MGRREAGQVECGSGAGFWEMVLQKNPSGSRPAGDWRTSRVSTCFAGSTRDRSSSSPVNVGSLSTALNV